MDIKSELIAASEADFSPKSDLTDKHNYSHHLFVDQDGAFRIFVRLNVLENKHREEIIAYHFALQYSKMYYRDQDQPQFYVIGRDCPWDFEYVLHDATTFFVEVTRIADTALLKSIQAENSCATLFNKAELKGHEVLKIEKFFPGVLPSVDVEKAKTRSGKNATFENRGILDSPRIFLRPPSNPNINLERELQTAIQRKLDKPHLGKERTILVLDNLTTHKSPVAFYEAAEKLGDFITATPFRAIWLYTGYYSDDNGQNCEFSFLPIKATAADYEALKNAVV
jgi:hypothetical protein